MTYKLHLEHGDFVRLAPNHISVAHPDSIRDVMGHGNGFLKSDFYSAFDNIQSGIFTTRDRAAHSRKRKFVSHMFSPRAMVGFEPYMTSAIGTLGEQMDRLIDSGRAGMYRSLAEGDTEIKARQHPGEASLDVAKWAAFLAFDIIGDLVSRDRSALSACVWQWTHENTGFRRAVRLHGSGTRYQRWHS